MTATVFPAYGLARLVVPNWYALAAAGAAVAVPALAYSPILVEEPLAYPISTLALWLIARALERPTWGRVAAAGGISRRRRADTHAARDPLRGAGARAALARLAVRARTALALRVDAAGTGSARSRSSSASRSRSRPRSGTHLDGWRNTMLVYKDRHLRARDAGRFGALAIGIGVLPVLARARCARAPEERAARPEDARLRRHERRRARRVRHLRGGQGRVHLDGLRDARRRAQPHLPLPRSSSLRRRSRSRAESGAAGRSRARRSSRSTSSPRPRSTSTQYPYYEAHGLSIAAFANRELGLVGGHDRGRARRRLRRSRSSSSSPSSSFDPIGRLRVRSPATRRSSSSRGAHRAGLRRGGRADLLGADRPQPAEALRLGRARRPAAARSSSSASRSRTRPDIWLTEFFNPSVRKMWSLDGSAIKVGSPILTPDLNAVDGTLTPVPGTEYALAVNGVELQAPVVDQRKDAVLYRIDGGPLKLEEALIGRESDGWMIGSTAEPGVARASYTRYDVSDDEPGLAVVRLTRLGWCPDPSARTTGKATVRIGPVGIGPDKQPRIEHVTETRHVRRTRLSRKRRHAQPAERPVAHGDRRSRRRSCRRTSIPSKSDNRPPRCGHRARRVPAALSAASATRRRVGEARRGARAGRAGRSARAPWPRREPGPGARRSAERRTVAARSSEKPAPRRSASTSSTRYWRGLRSKTSFFCVYPATRPKNARAVARVVDRAEDRRRRDRARRHVVVEVAELDGRTLAEAPLAQRSTISGVESTPR